MKSASSIPRYSASISGWPEPGSNAHWSSFRDSTAAGIGSRPRTYAAGACTITRARYRQVASPIPRATCAAISRSGGSARGAKRGPDGVPRLDPVGPEGTPAVPAGVPGHQVPAPLVVHQAVWLHRAPAGRPGMRLVVKSEPLMVPARARDHGQHVRVHLRAARRRRQRVSDSIQPFRIEIPQADVNYLRGRLASARWPGELPGVGWSRGIPLGCLKELAGHWHTQYDWRAQSAAGAAQGRRITATRDDRLHPAEERSTQKPDQCRHARTTGSDCPQPTGQSASAVYRTAELCAFSAGVR